jgi:hypothetical protein
VASAVRIHVGPIPSEQKEGGVTRRRMVMRAMVAMVRRIAMVATVEPSH